MNMNEIVQESVQIENLSAYILWLEEERTKFERLARLWQNRAFRAEDKRDECEELLERANKDILSLAFDVAYYRERYEED